PNARQIDTLFGAQTGNTRQNMTPTARRLDLQAQLIAELGRHADGVSVEALLESVSKHVSRRTLQRRLAEWSASGVIRAQGVGKARLYFSPPRAATPTIASAA